MFVMKASIDVVNNSDGIITKFRDIKPSAVKWHCSVSSFTDTCTINLPLRPYLSNTGKNNTIFSEKIKESSNTIFHQGDYVEVWLGYNYDKHCFFKGFVKRVNYAQPLVLECEGYSYLLKDVVFTKSYQSTTIRNILEDLTRGTNIKLSEYIPDVRLKNLTFKNIPGLNMLEWFAKECLCAVYFDENILYVGASKYAIPRPTEQLRIGWNTVEDKELKKDTAPTKININLVEKSSKGEVKRTKSEQRKYDNIKEVKVRAGLPDSFLRGVADELQKQEDYKGYKGNVTAFLMPFFGKGYVCEVIDKQFPDREGKYFVESVEGSFDDKGGRQKLNLIYYGKDRG